MLGRAWPARPPTHPPTRLPTCECLCGLPRVHPHQLLLDIHKLLIAQEQQRVVALNNSGQFQPAPGAGRWEGKGQGERAGGSDARGQRGSGTSQHSERH